MLPPEPSFLGQRGGPTGSAAHPEQPTAPPEVQPRGDAAKKFYVVGMWRRLLAALLDGPIVLALGLLLSFLVGKVAGISLPPSRHHGVDYWLDRALGADPALITGMALTVAVGCLYVVVFQGVLGRTPGMRVLKVRIIDVYGEALSPARAGLRALGYLLGFATLGLGFLWIGFDSEKRGIHDWLSGTYVVKA